MQAFRIVEPQKAELLEVPVPESAPGRSWSRSGGGRAPATPTCISWRRPRTGSQGSRSRSATRTRDGSRS